MDVKGIGRNPPRYKRRMSVGAGCALIAVFLSGCDSFSPVRSVEAGPREPALYLTADPLMVLTADTRYARAKGRQNLA